MPVENRAGMLVSEAKVVGDLTEDEIVAMWDLYSHYYGGTEETRFRGDLAEKTDVILSRDETGTIRGFSTIFVYPTEFESETIRVIFSGDTIIDHRYWAKNDFAFAWIRFSARIKSEAPEIPLFWFLIVKGHRTYRYMGVFGKRYYPAPGWDTPPRLKRLTDQLAVERFGKDYDATTGLVRFEKSHGHLKSEWAGVTEGARRRVEVEFFLDRNPGYARGDELVCLCEVSEENMKRITLRLFKEGLGEVPRFRQTG